MMTLMKRLMASDAFPTSASDPVTDRYNKVKVVATTTIATTVARISATVSAVWRGTNHLPFTAINLVPQLGHGCDLKLGNQSQP